MAYIVRQEQKEQ